MKYLILFIFSFYLFANSGYEVFEEKDNHGDNIPYAKVYGINESIELFIGVSKPKVLSLDETQNKRIKLLRCFGGNIGTSSLAGYYYTYVLDFKTKKILGYIEFIDKEDSNNHVSIKPKWKFNKESIEVSYRDWNYDGDYKTKTFILSTH